MGSDWASLLALEKKARELGFRWPDVKTIVQQAISECEEIDEAYQKGESRARIQEEIGDLIHCCVSLCDFLEFNLEETVHRVVQKFGTRLDALTGLAHDEGFSAASGHSLEQWMRLWQQAKKASIPKEEV